MCRHGCNGPDPRLLREGSRSHRQSGGGRTRGTDTSMPLSPDGFCLLTVSLNPKCCSPPEHFIVSPPSYKRRQGTVQYCTTKYNTLQ